MDSVGQVMEFACSKGNLSSVSADLGDSCKSAIVLLAIQTISHSIFSLVYYFILFHCCSSVGDPRVPTEPAFCPGNARRFKMRYFSYPRSLHPLTPPYQSLNFLIFSC